jgi:poly-gamma-glutamate synthesis protein (capsule biosynthesis protein)
LRVTFVAMAVLLAACGRVAADPPSTSAPTTTAAAPTTLAPTTTPSTTTTTTVSALGPPERGRLVIHAVGDVNFDLGHNAIFGHTGYESPWAGLRGIFMRDHLTIINLECSPSTLGSPIEKEWPFRCPLASLDPMREAGVEVASLANNHSGDMGRAALIDGRENLTTHGLHPIGAGRDLDEANLPAIFEIEGWTVAVVGFSGISGNGAWFAAPSRPGVAPSTEANITASVRAAAALADIVVVMVHWGIEMTSQPTSGDRIRAQAMIDAGADAIVGHHPHRLQPLEVVDGVPVFWSMGNFVWPSLGPIISTTAVAEIVIEPDGTVVGRLVPAYIVTHGHPELRGSPDASLLADRSAIE